MTQNRNQGGTTQGGQTQGQTPFVVDAAKEAKVKAFAAAEPTAAPSAVIEQGQEQEPSVEVPQSVRVEKSPKAESTEPKAKKSKHSFAVLAEDETVVTKDTAWYESEIKRIGEETSSKISKYESVFNKPYLKKFLEAEEENKDVWSELEKMVMNNPNKMSNADVYKALVMEEGISEDELEEKMENFDNMSSFDQKQITKGKRQELIDEFNKGRNNYDIDKYYERGKPDEKTQQFVSTLLDSVLSNNDKHVSILADYKQTAEVTKKIEKAILSGADGGFTAGFATTPEEAYTNIVMMIDQRNFMKHIQDAALARLEEGKVVDTIEGIKARPLIRAGEVLDNGINYREAIKGGIRREG